jgi:hypothetical protein
LISIYCCQVLERNLWRSRSFGNTCASNNAPRVRIISESLPFCAACSPLPRRCGAKLLCPLFFIVLFWDAEFSALLA